MMRKWIALLLAVLLLTACSPSKEAENTAPATETAAETPAPAESEQTAKPEPGEPAEEAEPVWRYPMGTAAGITAELAVVSSVTTRGVCYLLHLTSEREEEVNLNRVELLLNGSCCLEKSNYSVLLPAGELWITLDNINTAAYMLQEPVSALSCTLQSRDKGWEPVTFTAELSPEPAIALRSLPLQGAYASEQLLKENENVRVSLLFLGSLLGGNSSSLYALVRTENLSAAVIPFDIPQMTVNGIAMPVYVDFTELSPGMEVYSLIEISKYTLTDAGIEGISSVGLQIMTDYEENTGSFLFVEGGSWYAVALDCAAADTAEIDTGAPIWEHDGIEIGLLRVENAYGTTINWKLAVTNNSGRDISLSLKAPTINGETVPEGYSGLWLNSASIGNGAVAYRDLTFHDWEGGDAPEISFFVQVFNDGRGRILYTSEECTVIPSMPVEQD